MAGGCAGYVGFGVAGGVAGVVGEGVGGGFVLV